VTYATQAKLTERFGEAMLVALTDRGAVATGLVDASVIARALTDTDAMIDGYLATRYILPLSEVPPNVTDLALQIAIYKLHINTPDDKISKDYDTALKMLRDFGTGTIRIQAAGIEPASNNAQGVQVTDRERPFTADNMKGYI
jgi:phage gp36-like protein